MALAGSAVDLYFKNALYDDASYATATDSAHLLLHCDGADASTTFIDATGRHQITAIADAQVDTAQSKFGGASVVFDGTGDGLSVPVDNDFNFGTGDYTVDCWFRSNGATSFGRLFDFGVDINNGQPPYAIGVDYSGSSTSLRFLESNGTAPFTVSGVSHSTWHHVALVRSGSTTTLYVDGVSGGTQSASHNITNPNPLRIGIDQTTGAPFNGWIDELRVLKGTAAWTTTFTPPTAPYNVALSGPYAHLSCSRASIGYAQTVAGTLTQFAANALRITDKGLLVEDARTNLVPASQTLNNTTYWNAPENSSITADATAAPDGTTTADLLVPDTATTYHRIQITFTATAVTSAVTIYAKAAGYSWFGMLNGVWFANFDLTNGVIGTVGGGATASMEALANGWYRCIVVAVSISPNQGIYLTINPGDTAAGQNISWAGNGTSGIYFWGLQQEIGAFPSSYIPTSSAAATRAADSVTVIGNLNTVLSALPQSMMVDLIWNPPAAAIQTDNHIVGKSGGDAPLFAENSVTGLRGYFGGYTPSATIGNSLTYITGAKVAVGVDSGGNSIVGGGGTVVSNSVNSANADYRLASSQGGASGQWFGRVRRFTVWNSRLADGTLQSLTSPFDSVPNFNMPMMGF